MPYQSMLDELVRAVRCAQAALLLDGTGEVALVAGSGDERERLIGAYQGIALHQAERTAGRLRMGAVRGLMWRYQARTVILRPLKDGYYLVMTLGPEADVARGWHLSAHAQERLNQAL